MFLQISFWSYKVKKTSSFDVLKDNKNIPIIILLSTNSFCENLFHENVLRTFWRIRRNWNSTSKVNKSAQQESMADYDTARCLLGH